MSSLILLSMAIHFHCPSCAQPIEIDDEWAGKLVACPYCRNTVSAPAESTLTQLNAIPVANPLAQAPSAMSPVIPPDAGWEAQAPASRAEAGRLRNSLALAALVLSMLAVGCAIGARISIRPLIKQIAQTDSSAAGGSFAQSYEQSQRIVSDMIAKGEMPGWLIHFYLYLGVGGLFWVAALICGVIAVRWQFRRRFAVASLAFCGLTPLIFCCSGV